VGWRDIHSSNYISSVLCPVLPRSALPCPTYTGTLCLRLVSCPALPPDGIPLQEPRGVKFDFTPTSSLICPTHNPACMPCPFLPHPVPSQMVSHSKNRVEFDFTPTSNPECAATGAAYCGDNGEVG